MNNINKNYLITAYFLILTISIWYIMPVSILENYPYGDATIF